MNGLVATDDWTWCVHIQMHCHSYTRAAEKMETLNFKTPSRAGAHQPRRAAPLIPTRGPGRCHDSYLDLDKLESTHMKMYLLFVVFPLFSCSLAHGVRMTPTSGAWRFLLASPGMEPPRNAWYMSLSFGSMHMRGMLWVWRLILVVQQRAHTAAQCVYRLELVLLGSPPCV